MEDATKARNEMLNDWLRSVHAQCNWQKRIQYVGLLECYSANGRVFLVQHYQGDRGWEIYIPASDGNSTTGTLSAAAAYIRGELRAAA